MDNAGQLLGRYGLHCSDIHGVYHVTGQDGPIPLPKWLALNTNRMELIRSLGGDIIVVHVPAEGDRRMVDALLPEAEKLGVRIAIENTRNEPDQLQSLFECYRSENVGLCFDSGHAQMAGHMEILEIFLDRLFLVHLHDNYGKEDDHNPPGQGIINWGPLMQSVLRAGRLKTITLEIGLRTKQDRLAWLKDAYARLEKII